MRVGKDCSNYRLYNEVRNSGLLVSAASQAGCAVGAKGGNKNRKAKPVPENIQIFFFLLANDCF